MGTEYRIRVETQDREQLVLLLKSLPDFEGFVEERGACIYRNTNNTGAMPNAEAIIEEGGLYFCDYGISQPILGFLITRLVARFGGVQIEEYE